MEQPFDAETAAARVVEAMLPLADAERAAQEKRYLKGDLDFLGVSVPGIPAYVAAWTRCHLGQMSGVTFREAVRRLPAAQAAELRRVYRKTAES